VAIDKEVTMRRSIRLLAVALSIIAICAPAAAGTGMSSELVITAQDLDEFSPEVAYNSNRHEYFVVWHDAGFQSRSVMGKRLDRWGNAIAEYTIAYDATRDSAQASVAYDPVNDRYLVTYLRDAAGDGSDWDLYARIVPWDGPSASYTELPVVTWVTHQWRPRVAYAGTQQEFFVTWWNEDQTGAVPSYVSGVRINPFNAATLGSTMVISSGPDHRFLPEIAYNRARNEYLIVFTVFVGGQGDVWAVRLNADGTILGGGEFAVAAWADSEDTPKVAASPSANTWLVVWESTTVADAGEIYGRFVTHLGVDGAPVQFDGFSINERLPAVSCIGESSRFLVSWSQQYSSITGAYGVQGQVIDADRTMDETVVVRTVYIGEDDPDTNQLAAAGGASNSLVLWRHTRHDVGWSDIHGRVVHDPFGDGFEKGDFSAWSSVTQ
jgi:hypothetical protein